jgi:F0F1-type ATP synthase assembly protein I
MQPSASSRIAENDEPHASAAARAEHVAAPVTAETAAEALKNGPLGALVVAGIAVGLLFLGWLALYFFVFLPRGPIG